MNVVLSWRKGPSDGVIYLSINPSHFFGHQWVPFGEEVRVQLEGSFICGSKVRLSFVTGNLIPCALATRIPRREEGSSICAHHRWRRSTQGDSAWATLMNRPQITLSSLADL